jgi:molybdate transport system ATP-binding protein
VLRATILKKFPGITVDVEFRFEGGILVLFGPSGSGKSTVLNCLSGLLRPDRGDISLGDRLFFSSVRNINVPVRMRRTGYVFQHYALFPHMTVKDNVLYGVPGRHKMKVKDRYRMSVLEVLDMLKITRLQDRYPSELSGGEKQRVALARALMVEPELMLLDEPLSAVDHAMRRELRDELKQLQRTWKIPFVLVTHSREEMKFLADEVLFMKSGERAGHIYIAGKRLGADDQSASGAGRFQNAGIYPLHADRRESPVVEG